MESQFGSATMPNMYNSGGSSLHLQANNFFVDNDTNKIEWATIYMRSDIKETVLEHEIGHALGYLHYNKINHLMNSKWTQGGWDSDGLKN